MELLILFDNVNVNLFMSIFFVVGFIFFVIVMIAKREQKTDEYRKNRELKPLLYKQLIEEEEIFCPAGKKLMVLIDTLVNQPNAVYHVPNAPESAEARKIREDGDRTSRIRYCLQCIEDNTKCVENSTQDSFVQLETTGDSLLWNHQVLNYLKSFAPALKVVAEGINSIFEEEYSVESFERIRNVSTVYGMLYKYLNELATCCERAKGKAVDKAEMQLLSELLRGSGSPLAAMPKNAKRQLENSPLNDCVAISVPWSIDEILLGQNKVLVDDRYKQWDVAEDLRGNYKRVKKEVEPYPINQRSKSLKSS